MITTQRRRRSPIRSFRRALRFECLEQRRLMAFDLDDSISEAVLLGPVSTTPRRLDASISPDTDVNMYAIGVAAGQVVDFDIDTSLNGPGGLGSFLRLFNSQGQLLASNNDAAAPGENVIGFDAYLRFTISTAGTYYLGVSNVNNTFYNPITGDGDTAGGFNATGSYQLIVQALPIGLDNILSGATLLGAISTTAKTTDADITPDIDVDLYRFTVLAGQVVDFDIDTLLNGPGGLGSFLRLFSGQGQELAWNNDAAAPGENLVGFDAYLRYSFVSGGTYYLGVSNANNTLYNPITGVGETASGRYSIGNYQLIVQTAPVLLVDTDDSLAEAISLGVVATTPRIVNASISPDTDVNMYSLNVAAGQNVDFDIDTSLNGPGGLGSFLRLFNAQGQELAFNNDAAAPGENVVGFDAYLRYKFNTAGTYYLGVSNVNNVFYNPITGDGDTAGGFNATGSYQLIVQVLPIDTDNTLSGANLLGAISTTAKTMDAAITPDIDVDMYRLTVVAGQVVDFDIDTPLNGPGGLGSYLRLFTAQGQELAWNNDAAAPGESMVGFDAYLQFTFASGGTYYLGVSNANNTLYNPITGVGATAGGRYSIGNYQLIVQTPPVVLLDTDDSFAEAISLGVMATTPRSVTASISLDTDVNMYSLIVAAGQVVDFDIDTPLNGPGGLGSYLRLFNAKGQELAFNNDAAAPGENVVGFDAYLRYTFNTAGTYYLGVSNANNVFYNPITGDGDTAGGFNATGGYQLIVQALPIDTDDTLSEATLLGAISTTAITMDASITPDIDVDLYRLTVVAGQVVDFDIDTPFNGPGGLGTYLRLFNGQGQELAFNNDAAAPGESVVGFDAYLRYSFASTGTYYLGVSNANNILYNPITGIGETAGGRYSIGNYQLIVQALSAMLTVTSNVSSIPEQGGLATGTVARGNADDSHPLVVTLSSSDTNVATVPASVVIPVNQSSVQFTISAVDDHVVDGTKTVTITATATGFSPGAQILEVTDGSGDWHNPLRPYDVNDDGSASPIDALIIVNYLNANGPGPVPTGTPPPYLDVNGDNFISPIDALSVINELNAHSSLQGEGEPSALPTLSNNGSTAITFPMSMIVTDAVHAGSFVERQSPVAALKNPASHTLPASRLAGDHQNSETSSCDYSRTRVSTDIDDFFAAW